jgi:hypothetical protein
MAYPTAVLRVAASTLADAVLPPVRYNAPFSKGRVRRCGRCSSKHEDQHRPLLNGGTVIKTNDNQRHARAAIQRAARPPSHRAFSAPPPSS